jgi:hypothetical protein
MGFAMMSPTLQYLRCICGLSSGNKISNECEAFIRQTLGPSVVIEFE